MYSYPEQLVACSERQYNFQGTEYATTDAILTAGRMHSTRTKNFSCAWPLVCTAGRVQLAINP